VHIVRDIGGYLWGTVAWKQGEELGQQTAKSASERLFLVLVRGFPQI